MKATLEFDLPEDKDEFEMAAHALDWVVAVQDIVDELRRRIKYCDAGKEIADFNTWVWQMLGDAKLDPWGTT